MAMVKNERRSVIRLEGDFDLPAARLLQLSLRGLEPGDDIHIEFSRVRRLHDYGIAFLAQALTRLDGRKVTLGGLGAHHVRLLRYFGIDANVFRDEKGRRR